MGKAGRFRGEDVLTDQELSRGQTFFDVVNIRFTVGQIFTKDIKGLDLPGKKSLNHGWHRQPRFVRQPFDPPGGFELGQILGNVDALISGKNVGQSAHIAGALDIILTPHGDSPRRTRIPRSPGASGERHR